MDKQDYRAKTEQMLECLSRKSYEEAVQLAEQIDWKKVKNTATLCAASEAYEHHKEYQKSRDILFMAYDRSPDSRKIVYRLGMLALKLDEFDEAMDCYEEFVAMAPKDPNRFVFRYKILKARKAPLEEQIEVLEALKRAEYVEKWAFELAKLYREAGRTAECIEECDDLALWFSDGKYVQQALDLKLQYKPLTPLQQEQYNRRFVKEEPVAPIAEPVVEVEAVTEPSVEAEAEAEVATESEETAVVEEVAEVAEEEVMQEEPISEPVQEEIPAAPTRSIEEIMESWEEQQKENAQMIREELEKVEAEKAQEEAKAAEAEVEPEEEILPEDVRQLMEELETESEHIEAQKMEGAVDAVAEVQLPLESEEPAEEASPEQKVKAEKPLIQKVAEQLAAMDVIPAVPFATAEQELSEAEEMATVVAHGFEPSPQLDEDLPGIKLGNTDSMAAVAKALKNNVELPIEEIEPADERETFDMGRESGEYDTGFVVQGRYDLEAQSEIGLKAGLTEDQKKLFSYFVPVHGMSEQLVEVLQSEKKCNSRYGTSRIGNLLIIGRKGSGKTVLAVNVVKAIQKAKKSKSGKVAIVAADSMNKKDVRTILGKLQNGAIIIERASRLNGNTIETMCEVMEGQTGEMLVVLEDERKPLEKLMATYPQFAKKFTSRLEVPVFINDELVTFGQTYAKENGYKIDEMGILALYTRIDMIQRDERAITVTDVKRIVDDAIENSQKKSVKKVMQALLGKTRDEADRILLREEDFKQL